MKEFKSWRDFRNFEVSVKYKKRFIFDTKIHDFLQTVKETSIPRRIVIKKNNILFRTQIGCETEEINENGEIIGELSVPFNSKRMKPLSNSAYEGRANPKGIPSLYLSSTRETAVAEVRPWLGSLVSVGVFKIVRDINIVNCTSKDKSLISAVGEPDAETREKIIWKDIDIGFSRPITVNDSNADYAHTQILAELFDSAGFDGVMYRSSFGGGYNIVLFDLDLATLKSCSLFQIEKVALKSKLVDSGYIVRKSRRKP